MTGHAYAILDTTRLKVGNDRIEMVKLRNPWAKAGIRGHPIQWMVENPTTWSGFHLGPTGVKSAG